MGNVLDFKSRRKKNVGTQKKVSEKDSVDTTSIVDIGAVREEMIKEERRQVKRTILTEFISMHVVVPGFGLMKVSLYDINERGLSFDLDEAKGQYSIADSIEFRVYLNNQTYFPIHAKIAHVKTLAEEGVIRHGCEFVKDSMNNEALGFFIKFLESVTAAFRRDHGDILVSKINS